MLFVVIYAYIDALYTAEVCLRLLLGYTITCYPNFLLPSVAVFSRKYIHRCVDVGYVITVI